MTTWEYRQWRRWATWKPEHDWAGAEPFDSLDGRTRAALINQVGADTMPRLSPPSLVEACARPPPLTCIRKVCTMNITRGEKQGIARIGHVECS